MSFFVGHFKTFYKINATGHNLLSDNILRYKIRDVLVSGAPHY